MRRSKTVLLTMERKFTFPREVVEKAVMKAYEELGIKLPKEPRPLKKKVSKNIE